MYSSDLSLEPALHHHHLGVEDQVEYEALEVLVWVGCHCTGRPFPTLKDTTLQQCTNITIHIKSETCSLDASVSGNGC